MMITKRDRLLRMVESVALRASRQGKAGPYSCKIDALLTIERQLHRIGERQCSSEEMTEAVTAALDKREARLEAKAAGLAAELGAEFYHQCDCRGCQVYLIFPGDIPAGEKVEGYYTNGIAVCT